MTTYCYQPLSHQRAVRLIIFHPSLEDNAPLSCSLVETSLDQPEDYYALSYTWGGETPSQPMFIHDDAASDTSESSTATILVTPNCATALRRLRKLVQGTGTGIWVDAVCINQAETEEKNVQVSMMADIYRQAKFAIVWLGEEWAPKDMKTISFLSHRRLAWIEDLRKPPSSGFEKILPKDLKFWISDMASRTFVKACRDKESLELLCDAPYWTRAWTLQEVAHVNVKVLCQDSQVIGLNLVYKALDMFDNGHDNIRSEMWFHQDVFNRAQKPHLLFVFRNIHLYRAADFISMKTSDPRDKVFALRSQYPHTFGKVEVDYNRCAASIFTEATKYMLQGHESSNVVYEASRWSALKDLPSWAVDWAGNDIPERFWNYRSLAFMFKPSRTSQYRCRFSEDNKKLYLEGRILGGVDSAHIGPRLHHPSEPEAKDRRTCSPAVANAVLGAISIWISELSAPNAKDSREKPVASPDQTRRMQSFTHLISLLSFESRGVRLRRKPRAVKIKHWKASQDEDFADYFRTGRAFFTTNGTCGIGPCGLEPDDLICVFAGLTLPFIVRPQGSSFVLVGPSIIDGVMEGEYWPEDESQLTEFEII
ncbi:hypothetical protein GCG54_00013062 [Colletotrichum gloeosporioides]|uniref:Heterokaryon incompatibility domain-containing protein n=1 Tax=Colletotrichum gloeosporioides TaxID=474922 RepID=A0A8H4CQR6_COLGL|nr:uncharacterized protein GCG54_00013062 [Colletotrichum gloeosporioides]KAF3808423.1 hypothetical protein GCG54_00013062 [Colletotrichum gloeosporioides]